MKSIKKKPTNKKDLKKQSKPDKMTRPHDFDYPNKIAQ